MGGQWEVSGRSMGGRYVELVEMNRRFEKAQAPWPKMLRSADHRLACWRKSSSGGTPSEIGQPIGWKYRSFCSLREAHPAGASWCVSTCKRIAVEGGWKAVERGQGAVEGGWKAVEGYGRSVSTQRRASVSTRKWP